MSVINFEKYQKNLNLAATVKVKGRITELVGLVAKAVIPNVKIGELCLIERRRSGFDGGHWGRAGSPPIQGRDPASPVSAESIKAEVVGFKDNEVLLMPLGNLEGMAPGGEVTATGDCLKIPVGNNLLGRVLDGLGEPLDVDVKGPLISHEFYPVHAEPPDPMKRQRVTRTISVGLKAIDGILTCGEGQRIGLFAAAGVGKSTTIGMIARNTEADVNVIGLIGERGREVRDFLENDLGEEGLARSVVLVATSDQPSLVRAKAAYAATAVAEYFRDQGLKVLLMMDSVTRFARALREIGLAVGEPPARQGFTPSVFSTLPRLLERSGNSDKGSITAFYTVLVSGDDMNEPVADETRSILDGHIILSRDLAARAHYPAIDVSESISRVMSSIIDPEHLEAARKLREVVAAYEKERDLILIGAYEAGSDPRVDYAIEKIEEVNAFLKQGVNEHVAFDETLAQLKSMFG